MKKIILTTILSLFFLGATYAGCEQIDLCGNSFTFCSDSAEGSNDYIQEAFDLVDIYC